MDETNFYEQVGDHSGQVPYFELTLSEEDKAHIKQARESLIKLGARILYINLTAHTGGVFIGEDLKPVYYSGVYGINVYRNGIEVIGYLEDHLGELTSERIPFEDFEGHDNELYRLGGYLERNKLRMFLMTEEDKEHIRYALVLDENNNGLVFGYEGGGEYSQDFIIKGEHFEPSDIELEFDYVMAEWSDKTESVYLIFAHALELLGKYEHGAIKTHNAIKGIFDNSREARFGDIEPIDYMNTYWR